jgi:FkbM family methyltransferase
MPSILRRAFKQRPKPSREFPPATDVDIEACYRFFLRRAPEPAGLAHWRTLIRAQRIDVYRLISEFLNSEEFWLLCHNRHRPWPIKLDGFTIYVRLDDTAVGAYIANAKTYEPHVTETLLPLLRPGIVFLDIGANVGYYALLAASRIGSAGKVLAFEPNPDNCEMLTCSIRENGFRNIALCPYAVADKEQELRIYPDKTNSTSLVVGDQYRAADSSPPAHITKAVALDNFLKSCERIDIVKIDIDGGEPLALRGMQKLIQNHRPILFVEFCPELIRTVSQVSPESFLDQLSEFGYDLCVLGSSGEGSSNALCKFEILERFVRCKSTHLDLVAYPR